MSVQDLKNKFEELKKKFLEKKYDEVIEECNLILKKNIAKLERALINFMIDTHVNENEYTLIPGAGQFV